MAISKGFRYKDKEGKVTDYEYGVNGTNVTQDSEHRFVTEAEKQTWNTKADPEDIPSGSAASQAVANNCTTTEAGSVLDARQGKVLMDKANQLSSELGGLSFGQDAEGNWGYKPEGADAVIPFRNIIVRASTSYLTSAYEGHVRVQIRVSVYDGETLLVTDTIFDGHVMGSGSGPTTETIYP